MFMIIDFFEKKSVDMAKINDNDMEVILKGCQEEVIRKMLDDRSFALVMMNSKKSEERMSTLYPPSVFVGRMNTYFRRTLAIRDSGKKTSYLNCNYYLCISPERGEEFRGRFLIRLEGDIKRVALSVRYPTVEELLSFLKDKELFLITNYMWSGNVEQLKVDDFLENVLLLHKDSESNFIPRDEFCDIRIYLSRIDDEDSYQAQGLYLDDVRDFELRNRVITILRKRSKIYDDENYYSVELETRSEFAKAAYFLTRFHSNICWKADPVNIVLCRISVLVLPGTISPRKAKKLPLKKKTRNIVSGAEYLIDSIHFNSDIFYDIAEFEEFIEAFFSYFGLD